MRPFTMLFAFALSFTPAFASSPRGTIEYQGSKWEILGGFWRASGDEIVGSGGWLASVDSYADSTLDLDFQLASGPLERTIGIAVHSAVSDSANELAGWTSSGYAVNFTGNKTFCLFTGIDGQWNPTLPAQPSFVPLAEMKDGKNHLRFTSAKSEYKVELNGKELGRFSDTKLLRGRVLLWVESTANQGHFSNIKVVDAGR